MYFRLVKTNRFTKLRSYCEGQEGVFTFDSHNVDEWRVIDVIYRYGYYYQTRGKMWV